MPANYALVRYPMLGTCSSLPLGCLLRSKHAVLTSLCVCEAWTVRVWHRPVLSLSRVASCSCAQRTLNSPHYQHAPPRTAAARELKSGL